MGQRRLWGMPEGWRWVVWDSFDRADSVVSLGSAETGQAWNRGEQGDDALPTWGVTGGRAYKVLDGGVDDHVWLESGVADGEIDCRITAATWLGTDWWPGVLFRRVDANNYWAVRFKGVGSTLWLLRCLAGVRSGVTNVAVPVADGETVAVKVVLRGDKIRVWWQGVEVFTYGSWDMAGGTKHGLYQYGVGGTTRYDNFRVLARR